MDNTGNGTAYTVSTHSSSLKLQISIHGATLQ